MLEFFLLPYTIFKYGISLMFWATIVGVVYAFFSGKYNFEFRNPIVRKENVSTDRDSWDE
jgi:hypothetical protein